MKSSTKLLLGSVAVSALMLTGGNAVAQLTGIAATKHNLGASNDRTDENRSNVADLCVFCHTPHGSDTSASAPLWNRKLPTAAEADALYTTYDSLGTSTLDGNILTVGSVSLACLSCHDGTQALDTVLNAPGSGAFNANGARIQVGGVDATWTGSPRVTLTGADAGKLVPGVISNLGTDLSNDHPVGIIYGGFSRGNDTQGNPILIDADFKVPQSGTIGSGATVWWVDTGDTGTGTREKTDMQLYTRGTPQTPTGTLNEPYVECASCHDPHVTNATFLRIPNNASAVCLACHTK
jgi:predicted CXXCH cytochrome family protein